VARFVGENNVWPAGWKLPTRGARSSAPTRASCSPAAPGPP
jgi:hypothetical protein